MDIPRQNWNWEIRLLEVAKHLWKKHLRMTEKQKIKYTYNWKQFFKVKIFICAFHTVYGGMCLTCHECWNKTDGPADHEYPWLNAKKQETNRVATLFFAIAILSPFAIKMVDFAREIG